MFRSHHVTVLYRYRGLIYTEYSSYAFVWLAFALVLVLAFALVLALFVARIQIAMSTFAATILATLTLWVRLAMLVTFAFRMAIGERDIKCISIGGLYSIICKMTPLL